MNSIESLEWRYAVKKFDENKSLTETQINTLKEAFNLTATSYGLQPIKMVVIQNKKLQQQLVEHSWNQGQVAQASHVLVLCIPKEYTVKDVESYFTLVKEVRNTPDEILNPFKEMLSSSIANKTSEELRSWNKNQAYIALGNLMTVAANEQIDSCPMEGFIPEKYDEILGLDKHNLTSVLVLPVGFRAEDDYMKDLKKVRRKTAEVVIEL
ncbi:MULTISPECIES: NAD(P)H-dependent oxidoreductase [unclassified Tenacibaculum]|uniref:NAD(P)H-dependent oxidoreductase n=1 Tax=unclassified Tenacibaculum TaxID=2635139 RepID=UPI001F1AA71C|nr:MULTISPECIES: NAD(P)H-dependent oxidoreductase [unclassified Tenacibaculum]MCF2876465.1 NAD(P)H-dependent oxidoreductase [Tenacibaculum sp. Cn5-1]MCF2936628.1 NAD(P)H-dependent oxidoreductase [Tenacibaculum sp. Cn5-34]MCG7511779.1 NAD(P)H-dependent oxidoreductase [Tenacibaculum sp. Cn5-46]